MATSKQSYKYLLLNLLVLRVFFRCGTKQWNQLCTKEAVTGPQTTLQGKAGSLITVMDDWVQLYTIATLLKLAKHCHRLFRAIQGDEKAIWKSIPGYLFCSVVSR